MPAERTKRGRPNLDIDRIIDAAWILVDRDGVDALSTRTLAAELNVQGPALYWHVRNMHGLLTLMIERSLCDDIRIAAEGLTWSDWLRTIACEQRRVFLEHRDSGRIASSVLPTPRTRTELVPQMIEPMLRAGFRPEDAAAAAGALASFILGWVIYEQRAETRDFASSMVDLDAAFDYGLGAFIDGLIARAPSVTEAQPDRGPAIRSP